MSAVLISVWGFFFFFLLRSWALDVILASFKFSFSDKLAWRNPASHCSLTPLHFKANHLLFLHRLWNLKPLRGWLLPVFGEIISKPHTIFNLREPVSVGKQQHGGGSSFPKQPIRTPLAYPPATCLRRKVCLGSSPLPFPFSHAGLEDPVCTAPWWVNYERSSDSWYSDQSEQTSELFSVPQAYAVHSRRRCAEISVWRQGGKEKRKQSSPTASPLLLPIKKHRAAR